MNSHDVVVLWREHDWRCEVHAGIAGASRLVVYLGEQPVVAETMPAGATAHHRAEVLRHRVRRGDLRASD
jgi:hypothetical protein